MLIPSDSIFVSIKPTRVAVLGLALSLCLLSANTGVWALGWSSLNPGSWFESREAKSAKQAERDQKKALIKAIEADRKMREAQQESTLYKQEAASAKQRLEAARAKEQQKIDALEAKAVAEESVKPVSPNEVTLKESAQQKLEAQKLQDEKKIQQETRSGQTTESISNSKKHGSLWNPLNWFVSNDTPSATTQAPRQTVNFSQAEQRAQAETSVSSIDEETTNLNALETSNETSNKATQTAQVSQADSDESAAQSLASAEPTDSGKTEKKHMFLAIGKAKKQDAEPISIPIPDVIKPEDSQYYELAVKERGVTLETEHGEIGIELYPEEAPITVTNFVKLVKQGFYNQSGMKFHRVVPGFVVQTGDPTGTGAGGSGARIVLETKNKLSHDTKGVVAMARGASPNSATSQFYITLAPQKTLDAKYAIFGRMLRGYNALNAIEKDDRFYGAKVVNVKTIERETDPAQANKGFLKKIF